MCYDTRSINSLKQEQITQSSIECINECKECYDKFIITRVHSCILSNEIKLRWEPHLSGNYSFLWLSK